jgi:hypothetical protein
MSTLTAPPPIVRLGFDLIEQSKPLRARSLRQFAEEEVVIPTGQYADQPFRCSRLPFAGILLDEIELGGWYMIVITAPSQSGKSLCGFVIPTLHMVLERREDTGFACPEADLHAKKWEKDFLPVMNASPRLRRYIPTRGPGSMGGGIRDAVHFPHGSSMLLFSRGGKDSNKAAVTLRTMHVTEAAGWSEASENSKEGGPLRQLAARMRGFPRKQRRIIVEGTTTVDTDLPWRLKGDDGTEKLTSSRSSLVVPCPHCEKWITPDREHLHGWHDAQSEDEAANESFWCCPACGEEITEDERKAANRDIRLLHYGQSIDRRGRIVGDRPKVSTLWFRATQFNNLLLPVGDAAIDEWTAAQLDENSPEREQAEKELCQFVHARPYKPKLFELQPLTHADITPRAIDFGSRTVPPGTLWLSRGVDVGQRRLHVVVRAWSVENGIASGRSIGIHTVAVRSEERGVRQGLFDALCELRDSEALNNYRDPSGRSFVISHSLVDAGWMEDVVWAFMIDCQEKGIKGWMPILGRGQSAPPGSGAYSHPTHVVEGGRVLWIGEQCHIRKSSRFNMPFVIENSDEWKSFVHDGYKTPTGHTGALSHFAPATPEEESLIRTYKNHLLAGKRQWKEVPKRGRVAVWVHSGADDHYFDADAYCCVGGFLCGVRVATRDRTLFMPKSDPAITPITMPDGRDYMELQR